MEQLFRYESFSSEPKIIGQPELEGESDLVEKYFLQLAADQGLFVYEAGMIKLLRKKVNKWDKMSTVPDFLIKENELDEGIFVEVTLSNEKNGDKGRQLQVMKDAGLSTRYVQLTKKDLDFVSNTGTRLIDFIKSKIKSSV